MSERTPWRITVGLRPHTVTALEDPKRGSVVYLRWWENGNWRHQSLGESCRTVKGKLIKAVCDRATAEARARSNGRALGPSAMASRGISPSPERDGEAGCTGLSLSIASAADLVFHPETGRWNKTTPHGKEISRALSVAEQHWGGCREWATLTRGDWRGLWRARLSALQSAGHNGFRGTELVIQRLATIADWLVEEGHVLRIQGPERQWRERLAADYTVVTDREPEPHRPRHTLAEMRSILEAAELGDPRFALLMNLGAELRLGQVARCRRSDLSLQDNTLTIRGRGKKGGTKVLLTAGQRASVARALVGYLQQLEQGCVDYPLFPAGQMPGGRKGTPVADPERHGQAKPIGRRWILDQFKAAEARAGVPHLEGRGAYGVKRAAVDGAKSLGISREGLMAHGGWSSPQIPDTIYADQEMDYARAEAARLRAQIRNEPETGDNRDEP